VQFPNITDDQAVNSSDRFTPAEHSNITGMIYHLSGNTLM